ncbi:unnamed protein product, partial [Ixodes pacificus]
MIQDDCTLDLVFICGKKSHSLLIIWSPSPWLFCLHLFVQFRFLPQLFRFCHLVFCIQGGGSTFSAWCLGLVRDCQIERTGRVVHILWDRNEICCRNNLNMVQGDHTLDLVLICGKKSHSLLVIWSPFLWF